MKRAKFNPQVTIKNHIDFIKQLRKAARIYSHGPLPYERRCVIVHSPAGRGWLNSAVIEWEGTPPRDTVFVLGNRVHSIGGKKVHANYAWDITSVLSEFLSKYPPNPDGSPVWIDAISENANAQPH